MFVDNGPYRKHYYSTPDDSDYAEILWIPDGWKPIVELRRANPKMATTIAAVAAVRAWALVAVAAASTFAG